MGHLKALFTSVAWHKLAPDSKHELVVDGFGKSGEVGYVTAALAGDGSLAVAYLPAGGKVTVDLDRLRGKPVVRWFDPTDGSFAPAGVPAEAGRRGVTAPDRNTAGDRDFLLILTVTK
jgi:hypothetical protein